MRFGGVWLLFFLLPVACDKPKQTHTLGEGYVGPMKLDLRAEVHPSSKVVATLQHGERVEVVQVRRRFLRVRTASGIEGWTDVRQLMRAEQMEELRNLFAMAKKLKSQGEATVYEPLNVHTEPVRRSPSFYQIQPGEPVEVVGHQIAPRNAEPRASPFRLDPPKPPARKKKQESREKTDLPRPPAPKPPEDWVELSRRQGPPEDEEKQDKQPPRPVPMDDWSLVRLRNGKAGWALSINLRMNIPDEVAQYNEGARITSYFSLGTVRDGEEVKHNWLWTTMYGAGKPYEFDSFRVFVWVVKRHRYETAYIERNVEGYYPGEAQPGKTPIFSLILRDPDDGKLYRKTYAFEVYRVVLRRTEPWEPDNRLVSALFSLQKPGS
jgi:hypothetical protein